MRTCVYSHYLFYWCPPGEEEPTVPSADGLSHPNEAAEEEVATSGQTSLFARLYAYAHMRIYKYSHLLYNCCFSEKEDDKVDSAKALSTPNETAVTGEVTARCKGTLALFEAYFRVSGTHLLTSFIMFCSSGKEEAIVHSTNDASKANETPDTAEGGVQGKAWFLSIIFACS